MVIGKKKGASAQEMFAGLPGIEERVYSEKELREFHEKIQRFRQDKTLTDGETIRPLNWSEMAVAFGAMSVIQYHGWPYYRVIAGLDKRGTRFAELCNLWGQYQDWQRRGDWIDQKKLEAYEKYEEPASLDELSTVVSGHVAE